MKRPFQGLRAPRYMLPPLTGLDVDCRHYLTRIIHEASTAAADPGMYTALRSLRLLDVLFKYACGVFGRAPCIHARLHRLATNLHE